MEHNINVYSSEDTKRNFAEFCGYSSDEKFNENVKKFIESKKNIVITEEQLKKSVMRDFCDISIGDCVYIKYTPCSQTNIDFYDNLNVKGIVFFIDNDNEDLLMYYDEIVDGIYTRFVKSLSAPTENIYSSTKCFYVIYKAPV